MTDPIYLLDKSKAFADVYIKMAQIMIFVFDEKVDTVYQVENAG